MAYYNTPGGYGYGFTNYQNPSIPNQRPSINPNQFMQVVMTLDKNALAQLAQMARNQGISDQDIQDGLKFINSLR